MIEALSVFLLMALLDIVWVKCIWSVDESTPNVAAAWSTAFYVISTLVVLDVVKQSWLIVPAAAGAFAGTWWVVWRKRARSNRL